MDYDKTEISKTYNRGRDLAPEVLQKWMDVVASHVDESKVRQTLDLGCGTGRFSSALSMRFAADVIAIDPSKKMLGEVRNNRDVPDIFYVCGCGEALPLPKESVDLIFISMAFHHFNDPELVARECARVLRRHGRVFLRAGSRERISMYPYVPYFPTSRVLLEQRNE